MRALAGCKSGNIYGLPVSGHAEATSLFSFGPTPGGNDLISGGSYGIEASTIGTLVLVVATLIAYAWLRRRATSPVAAETPEHATT